VSSSSLLEVGCRKGSVWVDKESVNVKKECRVLVTCAVCRVAWRRIQEGREGESTEVGGRIPEGSERVREKQTGGGEGMIIQEGRSAT